MTTTLDSVILNLDELAKVDGVGRNVLEARIRALVAEVRLLRPENRRLNDNLTATQTRCTELLNEIRSRGALPAAGLNGPAGPSSVRVTKTRFSDALDAFDPELGCPTP